LPANSPRAESSVKIFPAISPNFGLRNCVNVAFMSAVVGSFALGRRRAVFTGTMAPDCLSRLSPKLVSAEILKKPPGQRPSLPVSTLRV
jgi:hypothetical protein